MTSSTLQDPIIVVGSGPSAMHYALTALELGRKVTVLDIGFTKPDPVRPDASLNQLKSELPDPVDYFLGEQFESVILPGDDSEYYGFPPSKSYVFRQLPDYLLETRGMWPLLSFATGGLAQAWTGGSYPFSDGELDAFPFGWDELEPHYSAVARRIGISGSAQDDLAPYMPAHDGIQDPVELSAHARKLLTDYQRERSRLQARGFYMGHARLATLSRDHAGRPACAKLGRCLWGCPQQSLYTPSITLDYLRKQPGFEYIPNVRVDHFRYDDRNRVIEVIGASIVTGEELRRPVGSLVLGAGTLASARILLESLARTGVRRELSGLMDNRQVLMPFVNLGQVGKPFDDRSYQYHQLAIGMPGDKPIDYVHGLVTTLTTGLVHPVAQSLPVAARTAMALFRNIHAALGLVNINFGDFRREGNRVGLDVDAQGRSKLLIHYEPDAGEPAILKPAIQRFRSFLWTLNCVAPPNMTRLRPMGASVHYAGTLPMSVDGGDFTCDRSGRCRPFENLVFVDGSNFPSLPAKNLTFTLMANATRIAHETLAN